MHISLVLFWSNLQVGCYYILGMHDYSPFLAMHTLIDFWTAVGPDKIRKYIYDLVRQAGRF